MKLLLALCVFVFSISAQSQPIEFRVPKDAQITVKQYMAKQNLFEISITDEPAMGPNVVKPEDLKKALGIEGSLATFMKKKDQWIGSVFTLHEKLPLQPVPMPKKPKK